MVETIVVMLMLSVGLVVAFGMVTGGMLELRHVQRQWDGWPFP